MNSKKKDRGYRFIKRTFDISVSLFFLILLFPIMLIVGLITKCTSRGPIFYLDNRYGKNKRIIKVIKFRSMFQDCRPIEEILTPIEYKEYIKSFKLRDDPRTTKWGKIMRKTSLDELPQLINILKGDMSFVGPRPIVTKEYEMLWGNRELIFDVRPGLTGYWAVNGRSSILDYQHRVDLECYYVLNKSLGLDTKILFKTFFVAIGGKGAV